LTAIFLFVCGVQQSFLGFFDVRVLAKFFVEIKNKVYYCVDLISGFETV
jgi:hypothetical protein